MPFLDVQAGEVIVGKLNFGAVNDLVAHADKHILDLLKHLIHRVLVAHLALSTGDGNINGFTCQLCLQYSSMDSGFAFFQPCLNRCTDGIGKLTHNRSFFRRKLAHLLQNGSEFTFLTQQLDPKVFQRCRSRSGIQCCECLVLDLFQLFFHILYSFQTGKYKKITLRPQSGRKEDLPRYHPQFIANGNALSDANTPLMVNGITRQILLIFRQQLVGESPMLHASGSHHPALSCAQASIRQPSHRF